MVDDAAVIGVWGRVIKGFETTNRRLHAAIRAGFDLGEAEAESLLHLHLIELHRAPIARLARAAAFTTGGYTKVADKLVARGLARRVPSTADRRVIFLELTDAGLRVAGELASMVADFNRARVIGVLGAERAELVAQAMVALHEANARTPLP